MTSFGKQCGGGRRAAERASALLPARLTTTTQSHSVSLLDVSASGARVSGPGLPDPGAEFILAVERAQAFAQVCWSDGEERGLLFDEPLTPAELKRLQAEAHQTRLMRLSPEQKLAMQDWIDGPVR
jgi:hypothetical protein